MSLFIDPYIISVSVSVSLASVWHLNIEQHIWIIKQQFLSNWTVHKYVLINDC